MTFASGSAVGLSYVAESTRGTTPGSPTMLELRSTGRNINFTKTEVATQERRSDRQIADSRHGFEQGAGTIPFELAMTDYDNLLLWSISAASWSAGVGTGSATLTAANSTSKFTRGTGSFVTDGFKVGDWITTTGMTQTTTYFHITSVSALELTVTPAPEDHTGAGGEEIDVQGRKATIGTTLKTFSLERRFTDITQYQVFTGCAINALNLAIQPERMVEASMDLIAMTAGDMSGSSLGSPTAASGTSPFSAYDGSIYRAGVAISVVTGMNIQIANNRSLTQRLFSRTSPDVFEGEAMISGDISFLVEDATLISLFEDETEFSVSLKFDELGDAADFHAIYLPRVKLYTGDIDPPREGPIILNSRFKALYSSTLGTSLAYQISNAS